MLILASSSPRRKEILSKYFDNFEVINPTFDESKFECDDPFDFAQTLAFNKAQSVAINHFEDVVIGCDTVIDLDGEIIGKPKDYDDAVRILKKLSGKRHRVISGVTFFHGYLYINQIVFTNVIFNELTDEQIKKWLEKNTYLDKAGAYAIQEDEFGFVKEIKGSYDNVVGFPTEAILKTLADLHYFPNKEL